MKKKIVSFIALLLVLILGSTNVFALTVNTGSGTNGATTGGTTPTQTTPTTTQASATVEASKSILELVEDNTCKIDLDGKGEFTKKITDFNADKKEVTLTLSVTNTMQKEKYTKPVELFLVLDNSHSMTETYLGKPKMDYVAQTAKLFTESLFEYFTNAKVGIIGFSSLDPVKEDETIDPAIKVGTLQDAKLLLPLSNSKAQIESTITSYKTTEGPYTNIEAGLSLAQTNFTTSTESEKYVILISDGVPNLSLDATKTLTYSGVNAQRTKDKLKAMETAGYHIYSVLMGLNESNKVNDSAPELEDGSRKMTYRELAEEIFGTKTSPTAGDFYYIDYNSLQTTVNTDIYNDIAVFKDNSLKNIVIKDYFPQEIIDNFNYAQVTAPTVGSVSAKVNTTDNSITWTIENLEEGKTATFSYKLILKDKYDAKIVDKILSTNKKVDIDFEIPDGTKKQVTSDVSPKIRLKIKEVPVKDPTPEDPTTSKEPIPQTGIYSQVIIPIAIVIIAGLAITFKIASKRIDK